MKRPSKSERRQKHLNNLSKIFGIDGELLKVCYKSLRDIEHSGHRIAEKYCNGEIDSTEQKTLETKLKNNLLATLKYASSEPVKNLFFNWDPRGHFLKLNNDFIRENKIQIETDWGGYGIICPDEK